MNLRLGLAGMILILPCTSVGEVAVVVELVAVVLPATNKGFSRFSGGAALFLAVLQ